MSVNKRQVLIRDGDPSSLGTLVRDPALFLGKETQTFPEGSQLTRDLSFRTRSGESSSVFLKLCCTLESSEEP